MTFTLPSYCKALPAELSAAELLGSDENGRQFRANDFNGLDAHDQLILKLAIMSMRGSYVLQSEQS